MFKKDYNWKPFGTMKDGELRDYLIEESMLVKAASTSQRAIAAARSIN
jgi:hypothetical protein